MQKFCYKCGKIAIENFQLIDNLCHECYKELHPLLKFPNPLYIKLCKKCYRYFYKNRWITLNSNDLEEILDIALKDIIPTQIDIIPQTELDIKMKIFNNIEAILKTNSVEFDLIAKGHAHNALELYTETYDTRKINLNFTICPSCLSVKRGAYQAVLHIITPGRDMLDEEREYIFSLIDSEVDKLGQIDYFAYISKFTIKKGKITLFLGSEKFAHTLASDISNNLGGTQKETYNFGARVIPREVKQNKLYISLHLSPFIKGDLIWLNNSPLYVLKIKGKNITCIDLNTHEKMKRPLKLLKNTKILQHPKDLHTYICYSQTKEMIQLMDLENYQIFELLRSSVSEELEIGNNVKGFEVEGKIFLIPTKIDQ